jgi:Ca-activated chloride channel family protein
VYSPSHEIETDRHLPTHLTVKLASSAKLDPGPFLLSYLLERAANSITASLLAYPDPKIGVNGRGGYFLLMAGLPASMADAPNPIKREVTLVIDRSGSMAGEKMDQAKAAALQVVEGLGDGEAFNVIDYSTQVSSFAVKPVIRNNESRLAARKYIESIRPTGGTNIHDALVEALRPEPTQGMLPIVLFLTDGMPTVGKTSELAIRELVEKGNPHHRRVFAFGVGQDVNVPLLDRIADVTRAMATYVLPQEDVEVKVAQVFKKLFGPVLSDLNIETIDSEGKPSTRLVRELIPSRLPDLFEGDQLILLGQYQEEQVPVRFRLTGNFLGEARKFEFEFDMHSASTKNAFVPRLWASRRIAYLVDQIRQAGAESATQPLVVGANIMNDPRFRELTEEILRLSTEFGILTEYTSFLATEGTNLNDWNTLALRCGEVLNGRAVQARSGMQAVNQGIFFNDQKAKGCSNPNDNRYLDQNLARVEITGVQQVCDRAFFKRGNQWIDGQLINRTANPPAQQELKVDAVIDYGSPEHLDLLHRLMAQHRQGVLSLDGDIMIQFEGRNILVRNDAQSRSH